MSGATAMLVITTALGGIMLAIVWSLRRCGLPGVREWWQANLTMTASMMLFSLRGTIPDLLAVVVANTGLAFSLALYHAGTARFCGRTPPWRTLLTGIAGVVAGIVYWRYMHDDANIRVVVVSVFHAGVCFATGIVLLRGVPARTVPGAAAPLPPRSDRAVPMGGPRAPWVATATFALLFGIGHTLRGILSALASLDATPGAPMPGFHIIFLALGALVMPILSMGAVLMIHGAIVQRLEAIANTDFLTGVLSRKAFEDMAARAIGRAANSGTAVALLIVDVDRFKMVNDTWGHAAGDAVLTAFAQTLTGSVRPGDRIGRLGGEEFAVLLPGATGADAQRIAERIRAAAAAAPVHWGKAAIAYTVSGGHATWRHGDTLATLAERADAALYLAKVSGRNRVHSAEPAETGA
ncbi:GGDEF domain-containing protein [Cupriavidus sp. AU9028]|uniref:GGDEF domain-containing protein n=1 Tax=Cupriavidus sp. AU9028 TaxID=2871157 RepID=UPI001C93CF77|nr:GGDEF domain-containing protein [Cupriavidus sp. AU9028]MBY4896022.1 GGDEF domain-containing protein [Cupriavidus sp. AU9028]